MHDTNSKAPSVDTDDPYAARHAAENPDSVFRAAQDPINNPRRTSADVRRRPEADSPHTTNYTHNLPAIPQLYAIIDSVTDTIIGGIQVHLNNASAIRTLRDIALGDTMLNKHPLDYDLWLLGSLTPDHRITPGKSRIITGAQIEELVNAAREARAG